MNRTPQPTRRGDLAAKHCTMTRIKTTHIDTGGHGYYSVSKKDIRLLGIADKITGYSGQNINRVYLEEDQDGALLHNACKEKGIELVRKSSYNLKFKVTHNYDPALFDWKPVVGKQVVARGNTYTIGNITATAIVIVAANGKRYRISLHNPFKHIESVIN